MIPLISHSVQRILEIFSSMNDHINLVWKKSFNGIRNISTIRKYLTLDVTNAIEQDTVGISI